MRTSLVVQWLRLESSNAGDMGLNPGMGTKIPHAAEPGQKKKKEKKKSYGLEIMHHKTQGLAHGGWEVKVAITVWCYP